MNIIEKRRAIKKNKSKVVSETKTDHFTNLSIDIIHEKMEIYFKELKTVVLQNKRNEIELLKKNISLLNNSSFISTEVDKLENEIDDILKCKEENEYYLSVSNILKEYYANEELSISKIKTFGQVDIEDTEKLLLFQKYLDNNKNYSNVIPEYANHIVKTNSYNKKRSEMYFCKKCNKFDTICTTKEGYICSECGVYQDKIISNIMSYNDRDSHSSTETVSYKRFNYFKETLFQIQGNETTEIPQRILDKIIIELDKENFTDLSKLTIDHVKGILKKIGHSKWYEHTPIIINKINHQPSIKIPSDVQEKLFYMFHIIEPEFDNYKFDESNGTRSSFFSYPYCIHKLFELLLLNEYYIYFPYLTDRDKLHNQDKMWKSVINGILENKKNNLSYNSERFDINWRYIKST